MTLSRKFTLAAALAVAPLVIQTACNTQKSEAQSQANDLVKKVAEAEGTEKESKSAQNAQSQALQKAGVTTMGETVQLTPEQRSLLEARVKEEKRSDTAALLQEILDRDKKIGDLETRVAKLKADIPKPQIATEKDNHYAMALRYLRAKGLGEEKAKTLLAKVNLMEDLQPGWQVYNYYSNGVYLTTVTQGKSTISPSEYVKGQREALERERDDTKAIAHGLADEVERLVAERTKITEEVENLRTEKTTLMSQVNDLTTLSDGQRKKLTSLHYLVGQRKQLEQDGVIVVPIFAKDRMGPKAVVAKFDKDLPLDGSAPAEVTIKASDAGLKKIGKVNVIPGSLIKDQHYTVAYADDGSTATVKILDPERLKNDRVVFAVTD
jgi:uncharacterized coiled-coil DUF342 family protein